VKKMRLIAFGSALLFLPPTLGADGPFRFYSVVPCRVSDTRNAGGAGPLAPGEIRNFLIFGRCGIPSTARMAALNFTVVAPTAEGHLTAYPYNPTNPSAVPFVSTVNWTAGERAIANGSLILLTNNPTYNISVQAAGAQLDLVIDVVGYLQ
jgi:hypothetical protein